MGLLPFYWCCHEGLVGLAPLVLTTAGFATLGGKSVAGTLPLRYCTARFACRAPTWRLPDSGQVAGLVTADLGVAEDDGVEGAGGEVHWVSGSGPGRKRI